MTCSLQDDLAPLAVKSLRKKWWVVLFFALISLGQAYPYSVSFKQAEAHQCGCNLQGRECVHGCDLSHRHGSRHSDTRGHDHHGHGGGQHSEKQHLAQHNPSESQWVAPRCSQAAERKLLSLQGDPFLLNAIAAVLRAPWGQTFDSAMPVVKGRTLSVDLPPPRRA